MKKTTLLALAAAVSFFGSLCCTETARAQQAATPANGRPVRFDHLVRNDYFAGFTGDSAALQRAMKVTEQVLASEPNHAEALVWHGSGMFFLSGQSFQQGDSQKGMELWTRSMAMMDRAVQLAPDRIGVRIPRGAVMLASSRFVPPDMQKELIDRALADYSRAYELQKDRISTLATHPKGELLSGLAELQEVSGRRDESKALLQQIVREMAGTPYAKRAEKWLAEGMPSAQQRNCVGCHTPSN